MNYFELVNISERHMDIINPISEEKIVQIGQIVDMDEDTEIIDYGCGYAMPLILWAEVFGTKCLGIELREHAINRAHENIEINSLQRYVKIHHEHGKKYDRKGKKYDIASCMGATFIWDNLDEAIEALKDSIKENGRIILADVSWKAADVPDEARKLIPSTLQEIDLFNKFGEHNLELIYIIRSSDDDWAEYEASNWYSLAEWLRENPDDPKADPVSDHLRISQKEYFQYFRQYLNFAVYILEERNF
ncbi:MAG: methyltransferase domain-containing protein [Candidatus Zixiibacteriota bacterium]